MGWCSDEDEDVEVESVQRNPKLELLPSAAEELSNRFNILHCQFFRHGIYEKRIVFLLNEMLRRKFIIQEDYQKATDRLDIDIVQKEEIKEDKAEVMKRLFQSTMDCLVTHDKKKMLDLLKDFRDEVDEDFINVVHKLEELVDVFLEDEFLNGKSITPMIDELTERKARSFSYHEIKTTQIENVILNDINSNRYRVQTILAWFTDAQNTRDISNILEQLVREEMFSH